jgi:hypothetical protein
MIVACTSKAPRCKTCGMKIDPASAWRTELVGASGEVLAGFDTPRCAFQAWRSGKVAAASLRVPEYYDRQPRTGTELRFVVGGDVVGPMGPDLVPVEPSRAAKFVQDHGAERALRVDEVTAETLAQLK